MTRHSPPQLLSSAFIPPLSFSRVLSFLHQRLCRRCPLHVLGCSLHPSPRPPFVLSSLFSTRSLHRSSFIRQRFGRSVHPSSWPEPIRCIHPPLSRSVSHPHSVASDSSLISYSSVLVIIPSNKIKYGRSTDTTLTHLKTCFRGILSRSYLYKFSTHVAKCICW